MRIAIPTDNLIDIAEHFGRCRYYIVLDENGEKIESIENTGQHMGGKGLPPEILKENNIDVLLCRGLGPRAVIMCQSFGIDVYVHPSKTVKEIFSLWKDNRLEKATEEDACQEHRK